jgi:large subunit ribosomal protein L30
MADKKTLKVTLVKSPIACRQNHQQTVRGLGLRKIRQTVEVEDSPAVRGMLKLVNYLVRVDA